MVEVDGAAGEGGGQILRTALALSMCTGQALTIRRIRANRPKPGLMRQHLTCVQAAVAVSSAAVSGDEPGSQTLLFEPRDVKAGEFSFKVGTAGSCTLVLQTVLPALMNAEAASCLHLGGGTHNPMAPPYQFLERSFAPLLGRLGVGLDLELRRHGFYPAGGGEMIARIKPATTALKPFDLTERGAALEKYAESLIPALPRGVATRELAALGSELQWDEDQLRTPAIRQNEGPGNALMATLRYEQVCEVLTTFGERGVSSERVAKVLAELVLAFEASPAVLGPHLADQWMLPLALAVAASKASATFTCTEVTEHARTNASVIARFLPVGFDIQSEKAGWRVTAAPILR
jgi:RNA 3'-terminal phosphate cyclase (ATP)